MTVPATCPDCGAPTGECYDAHLWGHRNCKIAGEFTCKGWVHVGHGGHGCGGADPKAAMRGDAA